MSSPQKGVNHGVRAHARDDAYARDDVHECHDVHGCYAGVWACSGRFWQEVAAGGLSSLKNRLLNHQFLYMSENLSALTALAPIFCDQMLFLSHAQNPKDPPWEHLVLFAMFWHL